jgi:hypothetical protein
LARRKKHKIPPVLFARTQKIVEAIAKETGGTFLSYWNSTGGSVCQNDVLGFYEVLQKIDHSGSSTCSSNRTGATARPRSGS